MFEEVYRTTYNESSNISENYQIKQFKDILLRNKNLNTDSKIQIMKVNENLDTTIQNSTRLQQSFKNNVKNGEYKNKATDYVASITSETKGKIINPTVGNLDKTTNNYILRMVSENNLPSLFENAVYIDTMAPMKGKQNNINEIGYHHFVAPININGVEHRVLISGKEKQNSKKLYSLNIEIIPQKNGNTPLATTISSSQLRRVSPSAISISDLVNNVKIYNYDTKSWHNYNSSDIKYSMQESQNNTQWQNFLESNYKSTGTKTNMK